MKFRTELDISPFPFSINHQSSICLLGSCFSENMGNKLQQSRINNCINPHGTVFNAHSLHEILEHAIKERKPDPALYTQSEDWFYSFAHPSAVSAESEEALTEVILEKDKELSTALKNCNVLFITLGTSWAYYHEQLETHVANCHKIPQKHFDKRLFSFEQTASCLSAIQDVLIEFNPQLKIVFTVSPVKHIKDGIAENALSKAILLSAVHETLRPSVSFYFPSYELLTEDLRDYRYYKKDLIHPNDMALDYIWEKFSEAFFSETTFNLNHRIAKVLGAAGHRILEPGKKAHQFAQKQLEYINQIEQQIGSERFKKEKDWFQSLL